jgi:hypothetical protein
MKKQTTRNTALALVGLTALTIYILACTSFSPDDTKVLYPAFDPGSGAIGMAVYDREARRSDLLFAPIGWESDGSNTVAPRVVRGQWLPDGHRILVAWAGGKDSDDGLGLALVPWGDRGPIKLFRVPGLKDAAELFTVPLCLAGDRVFIKAGSGGLTRVDLKTGALTRHEFADVKKDLSLYPSPDGAGVFYIEDRDASDGGAIFGRLDPETFRRTPLMTITNEVADKSFFTYDGAGKALAFLEGAGAEKRLVVLRQGQPAFTRSLGARTEDRAYGNAGFSAKGDMVWASFQQTFKGTNRVAYGLMEIPLGAAPIRDTMLIPAARSEIDEAAFYFQAGVSHDGKTAAAASTYLACLGKDFKPGDCALFLVDLNDPNRRVTKVPIPLPPNRPDLK